MANGIYLRPLGLIYGSAATEASNTAQAGRLAGGSIAFTSVEIIEGDAGSARRRIRSYTDLCASSDIQISETLEVVTAPRPSMAGLSMKQPRIMGVVNVTPDSFSDGGLYDTSDAAIAHAARLAEEGADILDIGGESTRPGSDPLEEAEEAERIIPVIEGLKGVKALISADSRKAAVMEHAAWAGADILNDVSALTYDPKSLGTAVRLELPIVLMHAQGDPNTMQDDPRYDDVLLEVYDYLAARISACEAAGIPRENLIADPGIGFGKTLEHNLALLQGLTLFHALGVPLLLGASRKRFIGTLADEPEAQKRVPGSIAAALAGAARGVQVVRVHDVAETRQALAVWGAINA
jgi:dihydropteroate synthase